MATKVNQKLSSLIDQYAKATEAAKRIEDTIKELKKDPAFIELEEVETKLLKEINKKCNVDNSGSLVGKGEYRVEYGPCHKRRKVVDVGVVQKHLKTISKGLVIELAKYDLSDLDDYLTPEQKDECIETKYQHKRTLKLKANP